MTEMWRTPFVPAKDGRRSHRLDLLFMAQLRESGAGSTKFSVTIKDLSTTGFRCESGFALAKGARVWITIPGLAPLEAEVMWRQDYAYGCRFASSLHVAVLDHISKQART